MSENKISKEEAEKAYNDKIEELGKLKNLEELNTSIFKARYERAVYIRKLAELSQVPTNKEGSDGNS
jgi:hypothetical protein